MSLTSKQIDELRAYAADRKGELAKLINDAADTIEILSAKLHASQMERSSQYYHGGWIPVSERLPDGQGFYLVSVGAPYKTVRVYEYKPCEWFENENLWKKEDGSYCFNWFVEAWMPLPSAYFCPNCGAKMEGMRSDGTD